MTAAGADPREADLFETAPDAMAHLDADGGVIRANAAFRKIFRHPITPKRPPWGRLTPPPFRQGMRRFDAPAPDGRIYEWSDRRLGDGTRVVAAREITDRVQAAEAVSAAKTRLFATLTHELRTPLNGVLGMAGLIGQSRLDPEARDHLRALRRSGEHLLDLITEILDYSRLENGRLELDCAPFHVEDMMQSVAELLSPKAHEKGIEIAAIMRPGAPEWVSGDAGRVRQILFNLAGNAVKFTDAGGVLLEAVPCGRNRVRLSVRDTGPGISADRHAEIFEEFTQVDGSISSRYGGAGLGLAIVRRLADALGGSAGVESKPGAGSTFWVDVPLPESQHKAGAPAPGLGGARIRILSHNDMLAEAVAAAIAAAGGQFARALTPVDWADCDALLLDHGATQNLSIEAVMRISESAPVAIGLTPQEEREAIARFRACGVHHYALKPLRSRALIERLRIALGAQAPSGPEPLVDEGARTSQALAGLRVLLAEDNPVNALLARTVLARAGAQVDVAADGEEAVQAATHTLYDLIFLDLRMPRVDGFAAAKRMRALPGAQGQCAIIALTADSSETERARALASGMDDFIEKPFDLARLALVAQRFIQGARPGQASFS
ncbi:MAG: response regulator [Alphaproteobacteria bacterium]|nr:response regulator [Alphaproteobacteria bacterium]